MILLQPIGDEVADCANLETVSPSEVHQIIEAGHAAVVAHDLAYYSARVETRQPRNIDRGFGVPGANKHATGLGDQRKDMARRDDRFRSMAGIDRHRDRARAVRGADPGRNALARLDRDRERRLVAATVGAGHRLKPELVRPL